MERRYQVFVSSTYNDLIEERAMVKKALLEMECFPAGMEEFPALDLNQFEYIKSQIDSSDYLILILGGKVGTINSETKKSYTYMEYEYAKKNGIPILVFIKKNEKGLFCEESEESRKESHREFLKEAQKDRICNYFDTKESLLGLTHFGLRKQIEKFPRCGWKREEEKRKRFEDDLLLQGDIIEEFHIGKEIYEVLDQYFIFDSISEINKPVVLKYGLDTQGMFKLIFMHGEYGHNFYYDVNQEFFGDNDDLKENVKLQFSIAKLGNYSEPLLFFSTGDQCINMYTKVYRIGKFDLKEIYTIDGQSKMIVDDDISVPIGSQGIFEQYVYCKGRVFHV